MIGIENLREVMSTDIGTATGGTPVTLEDTEKAWPIDIWRGYLVEIVYGTGTGQRRRIIGNTKTELIVDPAWDIIPDTTSRYAIRWIGSISHPLTPAGNIATGITEDRVGIAKTADITGLHAMTDTRLKDILDKVVGLDKLDVPLSTRATEATLAGVKTGTDKLPMISDRLDVLLSTRASEATLGGVKLGTDRLDVPLSTRATEATLSAVKLGTDRLDVLLSTRASEGTLGAVKTSVDGIKTGTDKLDVPLSTRARAHFYDRDPIIKTLHHAWVYPPHDSELRASYTVPAGRKAMVTCAKAYVLRSEAATEAGRACARIDTVTPDSTILSPIHINKDIGAYASEAIGHGGIYPSGTVFRLITFDESTGGSNWYLLSLTLLVFLD